MEGEENQKEGLGPYSAVNSGIVTTSPRDNRPGAFQQLSTMAVSRKMTSLCPMNLRTLHADPVGALVSSSRGSKVERVVPQLTVL